MSHEPTVGEVSRNAWLVWKELAQPVDGAVTMMWRVANRHSTNTRRVKPLTAQQTRRALDELIDRGFAVKAGKYGHGAARADYERAE